MSDVPIDPKDYAAGVTVVDLGELRIKRGKARRTKGTCKHLNLTYDLDERRIWCDDCQSTVEPFDALLILTESYDRACKRLDRREKAIEEAEQFSLRSRASKVIDEAWRSKTMAPNCPHCSRTILPEDVIKGVSMTSKEFELKRRQKRD